MPKDKRKCSSPNDCACWRCKYSVYRFFVALLPEPEAEGSSQSFDYTSCYKVLGPTSLECCLRWMRRSADTLGEQCAGDIGGVGMGELIAWDGGTTGRHGPIS